MNPNRPKTYIKVGCAVFLILFLLTTAHARQRVETNHYRSPTINAVLPYSVVLPVHYDASPATRYPVLYLLHGLTGHYNDWLSRTNVADYAAQYRLIVVTPEGNDSWYTDSATVATDKYETYVLKELIPEVQRRYRTIEARYARGIAGLSMGGYGAFKLAFKFPGTFAFAGSMSGAFGVTRFTEQQVGASRWQSSLKLFGPTGSETRQQNDLFEIIRNLTATRVSALPFFYFDCGTEDSPLIFPFHRELAALMVEKKIPHEYRELPGDHSWGYWDAQV
ncbi:MAG TPA: alpha/beta hydrolase family protein, partial [Pyrinomonadaceae bacterium]